MTCSDGEHDLLYHSILWDLPLKILFLVIHQQSYVLLERVVQKCWLPRACLQMLINLLQVKLHIIEKLINFLGYFLSL